MTSRFRPSPNTTEHATRRAEWEETHRARMDAYRTAHPSGPEPVPTTEFSDDLDGDLDQIHLAVLEMKRKAVIMGETLEDHNHRVDNLNHEVELATGRVKASNKKVETILKK